MNKITAFLLAAVLCVLSVAFAPSVPVASAASTFLNYQDGYTPSLEDYNGLIAYANANTSGYYFILAGDDNVHATIVDFETSCSVNLVQSSSSITALSSPSTRIWTKSMRYGSDGWYMNGGSNGYVSSNYSLSTFQLAYSTIPYSFADTNYTPVDLTAPFTVTYQPELYEGMTANTVTYPSKQGANGQTVTSEFYSLDVTVSLSDSFLSATTPISGSFIYSYFFTTFIVPSQYCSGDDIRSMAQHAIYTSVTNDHYLYYENETLNVDMNASENALATGSTTRVADQWACADGVTNCYVLSRDARSKTFTIELENVPFEESGYTSFKIVTLGHITRMSEYGWVAYPYYFKSTCPELAFSHKKEFPAEFATVTNGVVDDNYTKWELYDYYTVVSDSFNYVSYPTYRDQGFDKSPLDFTNTANAVQDYDMHMQTGGQQEWRTEDEFNDYKQQKEWAENFGSDFGVGTISDLLNGESVFFGFLTASVSVLPSWFLTILSAAFVTLLAIVVIKFVL